MIVAGIVTKVKEATSIADGVVSVRVAVRQYKGDDIFMNAIMFGKTAEIVEKYVPVGGQMFISGTFQMEEYKDKLYPKVRVNEVELVRGQKQQEGSARADNSAASPPPSDLDDDEIPF